MEHYSTRLQRNFHDEDWLTRGEVAGVIAANSGRHLAHNRFVNDIARRQKWPVDRSDRYSPLYRYEDIKAYRIRHNPGRPAQDNPSPNAQRQRKFREKKQFSEIP
jgi:hypothetical protein